jgi:hypothetical protein
MAVVDSVSGEELNLCPVVMSLDSLTVVLRLHEIRMGLMLEKIDVFLTSEHWSDRAKETDLVV